MVLTPQHEARGGFWAFFDRSFGRTQRGYTGVVGAFMARPVLVMLLFGVLLAVSTGLFKALAEKLSSGRRPGLFHRGGAVAGRRVEAADRCGTRTG